MTDFSKMTVRCLTLLGTGFDTVNLQASRIFFFVPVQALGCWNLVLFVCLAIPNCIMPVALELTLRSLLVTGSKDLIWLFSLFASAIL